MVGLLPRIITRLVMFGIVAVAWRPLRAGAPQYIFTTLTSGVGHAPVFGEVVAVAADDKGGVYVLDRIANRVGYVTASGVVSTIAGLRFVVGDDDGIGRSARFWHPSALVRGPSGNLYVLDNPPDPNSPDCYRPSVRKVTPAGEVSTIYRAPVGFGVLTQSGEWVMSNGLAVDRKENLYVFDYRAKRVCRLTNGHLTPVTGKMKVSGLPLSLTGDADGNLYLSGNSWLVRVDRTGAYRSILPKPDMNGLYGQGSDKFQIDLLTGLSVDAKKNVYATDAHYSALYRLSPAGNFERLAGGTGDRQYVEGRGKNAGFVTTLGTSVDRNQHVYVAADYSVMRVDATGAAKMFVGVPHGAFVYSRTPYASCPMEGWGAQLQLWQPEGVAVDPKGGRVIVADYGNHVIRSVDATGRLTVVAGRYGLRGFQDGKRSAALLGEPLALACGKDGTIYFTEVYCVRKVAPDGRVSTVAGDHASPGYINGSLTTARFKRLSGIAVSPIGDLFVCDAGNRAIRKISTAGKVSTVVSKRNVTAVAVDPDGSLVVTSDEKVLRVTQSGKVALIAGSVSGSLDGTGKRARFWGLSGVAVARDRTIFVTERTAGRIARVTPAGVVTRIGGVILPEPDLSVGHDDGVGEVASFRAPIGIAVGAGGRIYVTDDGDHLIRVGDPLMGTEPIISQHPASLTAVPAGTDAQIAVSARSSRALTYQWQSRNAPHPWSDLTDGSLYRGTRTATLMLHRAPVTCDGQEYRCAVSTSTARVYSASSAAWIFVPKVYLVHDPSDCVAKAGTWAEFTIFAWGVPTLWGQWQQSTDGGSTWSDLTNSATVHGVNTPYLDLFVAPDMDRRKYRCVVANNWLSKTSLPATLTVPEVAPTASQAPILRWKSDGKSVVGKVSRSTKVQPGGTAMPRDHAGGGAEGDDPAVAGGRGNALDPAGADEFPPELTSHASAIREGAVLRVVQSIHVPSPADRVQASLLLPPGVTYVGGYADGAASWPRPGDANLIEWEWKEPATGSLMLVMELAARDPEGLPATPEVLVCLERSGRTSRRLVVPEEK